MRSPPQGIDLREADLSCQTAVHGLLQFVNGIAEPVLGNAGHGNPISLLRLQHGVALLQTGRHGLFHHRVHPRIHGVNRDLCMHIGRRAYVHQIDFQAGGEHFLMVVKNRTVQPVFLFHFLRLFRIDVAERCDPASVRKGQKPFHMGMGDIAASYYRCLYHLYLHSESSSSSIFPPSD